MRHAGNNIQIANIFDKESRNQVASYLPHLQCIDKKKFRFAQLTGFHPHFDDELTTILSPLNRLLNVRASLNSYRDFVQSRLQRLASETTALSEKIAGLHEDWDKGRFDVDSIGQMIQERQQEVELWKRALKAEERKIQDLEESRDSKISERQRYQESNSLVKHWSESWSQDANWTWNEYTVNYNDDPFDHYEQSVNSDTTSAKVIRLSPSEGYWKERFHSGWWQRSSGDVKVYKYEKNTVEAKSKVKNLTDEIAGLNRQINQIKSALNKLRVI